ncbi:hypothetical protein V3C99_008918, partial [Haemonchus contortus]
MTISSFLPIFLIRGCCVYFILLHFLFFYVIATIKDYDNGAEYVARREKLQLRFKSRSRIRGRNR